MKITPAMLLLLLYHHGQGLSHHRPYLGLLGCLGRHTSRRNRIHQKLLSSSSSLSGTPWHHADDDSSSKSYKKTTKRKIQKRPLAASDTSQKKDPIVDSPILINNNNNIRDKERNRYIAYLKRATNIIEMYTRQQQQQQPFSLFLKQYLAADKRMGAQDRRFMRQYCYPYFRLGYAFHSLSTEEKILVAIYLTKDEDENDQVAEDPLISFLRPPWYNTRLQIPQQRQSHNDIHVDVNTDTIHTNIIQDFVYSRVQATGYTFSWSDIFPFPQIQLSHGIDRNQWLQSMFRQPYLFVRVRPGKYHSFHLELQKAKNISSWKVLSNQDPHSLEERNHMNSSSRFDIVYEYSTCIQLPPSTNLDFVQKHLNRDYVVQDYSSQRVGELFYELRNIPISTIWDCCAGSGGKSILAMDILTCKHPTTITPPVPTTTTTTITKTHYRSIHLTVSDKRSSILNQLHKRFTAAQLHGHYTSFVLDLEQPLSTFLDDDNIRKILSQQQFDLVIADVPCSGSGTWARTPEQLCCFQQDRLDELVIKQRRILGNLPQVIPKGGYLLYCTCSVFAKENEDQVAWFTQTYQTFIVEKSIVLNGIHHRADTLFACLMRRV